MEYVPAPTDGPISPELVAKVVRVISRDHRLRHDEAADLESNVWLKLLGHDQRALKSFAGQCTLFHFVKVVATRVLLDMRTASMGKWRPTAAARRAGDQFVELECLVRRDGVPAHAAAQRMASKTGLDVRILERHLERLVPHRPRRSVALDEQAIAQLPSHHTGADVRVVNRHRGAAGRHVNQALRRAVASLSAEELRLLRLRYCEGKRVIEISRMLGMDAKRLYRHYDRLHARLRKDLSGAGVSRSGAADIVGQSEVYVSGVFEAVM